ncbi:MAG: Crp/Fnr family transcriptional regulator [Pseudomonadota bacterium]
MTADDPLTDILRASDAFGGLEDDALAAVVARGRRRAARKGEVLFSTGDPGDALYAILSGRVLLSRVTSEGQEVVLAGMERGEVFGDLALIDGAARSADATVAEAGDLFVLDRRALVDLIDNEPGFALALLSMLARRLRETNRLVESVSFLELGPRLARLLVILAQRAEENAKGDLVLASKYTQGELAKRIASSRESVSKQIAQWTRDGLVYMDDGRLALADYDALLDLADDGDLGDE